MANAVYISCAEDGEVRAFALRRDGSLEPRGAANAEKTRGPRVPVPLRGEDRAPLCEGAAGARAGPRHRAAPPGAVRGWAVHLPAERAHRDRHDARARWIGRAAPRSQLDLGAVAGDQARP